MLLKSNFSRVETLQMCITAQRRSSTLRIELTIPMLISAILVLVAPFFGKFQQQLYVKLFAILLQFLCFQYLVSKTPQIGLGDTVPTICKSQQQVCSRNRHLEKFLIICSVWQNLAGHI
jgi:hypothetical protein